jgi:hypothetical protein
MVTAHSRGKKPRAASRKLTASLPGVDQPLVSGREAMPPSYTSDGPRTSRQATSQASVYLFVAIGFHFGTYVKECKQRFRPKSWCSLADV